FPEIQHSLLRLIELHRYLESQIPLLGDMAPVEWPKVGESLLGFYLQEELGKGAFSRVFVACEPSLANRRVVVKVSQRGSDEAHTLGGLQHPHIIPVYSVAKDPERG